MSSLCSGPIPPHAGLPDCPLGSATPELIASLCDENTIGVVSVFGSTYTGEFEDTKALDAMVTKLNKANGWELVIHVDGASGAMVAPFLYPQLKFDFRLPNVASINISGHKYGLVYPGLGWALWRDAKALPESMVFYCDYLGTVERSITLNFSRGASNVISQYYQLLRLGKEGYTKIMTNLNAISKHVRKAIEATGHFEILSQDVGVPLVAFRLNKVKGSDGKMHNRLYDEFQLADRMRMFGWVLPAYKMPEGAEHVKLMRITIREDFSMTMARGSSVSSSSASSGWTTTSQSPRNSSRARWAARFPGWTPTSSWPWRTSSVLADLQGRRLIPV